MNQDLEVVVLDDGVLLTFCDPWCSGEWMGQLVEAHAIVPAMPGHQAVEVIACPFCVWCGRRILTAKACPLCPCSDKRPLLGNEGRAVASELFRLWRSLVGPTEDSDHLTVARLSSPIPERAWALAEDLLGIGGVPPRQIARDALVLAGYRPPR